MKALVVEDEVTSRRILQSMLTAHGECDTAADGDEAVQAFTKAMQSNEPYDIICLDISLPKLDGQQVLKKIRELEYNRNIRGLDGVKILMTTGFRDKQNVLEAFRSGSEGYLQKPIDRSRLLSSLVNLGLVKAQAVAENTTLSEEWKIFLIEAYENVDFIEKGVISLEKNALSRTIVVPSIFRAIHTIKGNCGVLGLSALEDLCHRGEAVLELLRDNAISLDVPLVNLLLSFVDGVRTLLNHIEKGQATTDSFQKSLRDTFDAYLRKHGDREYYND